MGEMMNLLADILLKTDKYSYIVKKLNRGLSPINITGVSGSQKAHLIYSLMEHTKKSSIIITCDDLQAKNIYEDLNFFVGDKVKLFPSKELLFYDVEALSVEMIHKRIKVMYDLIQDDKLVLVTSINTLLRKTVPKEIFCNNTLEIKVCDAFDITELIEKLVLMGYERVDMVEGKGHFSIRGGILDIFSASQEYPVRIEFFGDEVDSIRIFDILTQRSIESKEKTVIIPAKEIVFDRDREERLVKNIDKVIKEYREKHMGNKDIIINHMELEKEKIISQHDFPSIEKYFPLIYSDYNDLSCSILDYVSDHSFFIIDEPVKIYSEVESINKNFNEFFKTLLEKGLVIDEMYNISLDIKETLEHLQRKTIVATTNLPQRDKFLDYKEIINIPIKSIQTFHGNITLIVEDIKSWLKKNYSVVILGSSNKKCKQINAFLNENDISSQYIESMEIDNFKGNVITTIGILKNGFEYIEANFVVLIENNIFREHKRKKPIKDSRYSGENIDTFTDLNIDDYIVHQIHGIGIFKGLERIEVSGALKDYIKIKYLGDDVLYVPANQLELVQKYIGSEGKRPKLNKLGGNDWSKTKNRVKNSIKELAIKLNELYAIRENIKGYNFSKDTVWQTQFEESFPYEETQDQLRCISEVKKDMESNKPMDRLLCGDVGYGKTEVAIRAAFKAVMDQKQVAYLVPTTILAQQHYNTFAERMKDFPINVDMMSRFKTIKEQREIIKKLRTGSIDIIIGTHRILQKDIKFKDLGLLIIDEEQRFGVVHKETLKELTKKIDCISLSATPIPRTLHMSMIGIRDMSLLVDPPEGRHPVQTYVLEYDESIVKDAIIRELARGGQVFYLFNRVKQIDRIAVKLKQLLPEANIEIAHGQLSERGLEKVMLKVLSKEVDVLVCTTIIESGLDIPNVNTIIIDNADALGLSQLYQIRGRVGRTNKLAYAYLMYQKDKILDEIAEKRLSAIKEFTEFGSGFKIAMRDLEIRGAGNVLGPEQHGHMDAVGYDTFCKLLKEAVNEVKGEIARETLIDTTIDLNIDGFIPDNYISNSIQRFEIYKKISSIESEHDYHNIIEEIIDRYGELPETVFSLLEVALIKSMATNLGIESIKQERNNIVITFNDIEQKIMEKIFETINNIKGLTFSASAKPYIEFSINNIEKNKILKNIKIILQSIIEM
jgi:transcription-repair coupling factor (superfamily II helicase)